MSSESDSSQYSDTEGVPALVPAWRDSDDESLAVDLDNRRRKLRVSQNETTITTKEYLDRLRTIRPPCEAASWALPALEAALERANSGLPVLTSSSRIRATSTTILPSDRLLVAEHGHTSFGDAALSSLAFHPGAQTIFAASHAGRVHVYHPATKTKATTINLNYPVTTMHYTVSETDNLLLCAGRRRNYLLLNLDATPIEPASIDGVSTPSPSGPITQSTHDVCAVGPGFFVFAGAEGAVHIVSEGTYATRASARARTQVRALAVDGDTIVAVGDGGAITVIDAVTGAVTACALDCGGRRLTAVAVLGDVLAVGAEDGVLNIYSRANLPCDPSAVLKPRKSFGHLSDAVTTIAIHPSGELLTWASSRARDALKVAHLGAGTVFSNWPTTTTPLNRVSAVQFSQDGQLMAIANGKGSLLVYEIVHYAH